MWTKEKPTKQGYYWCRVEVGLLGKHIRTEVVYIDAFLNCQIHAQPGSYALDAIKGEFWSEPIEPPVEALTASQDGKVFLVTNPGSWDGPFARTFLGSEKSQCHEIVLIPFLKATITGELLDEEPATLECRCTLPAGHDGDHEAIHPQTLNPMTFPRRVETR